MFAKYVAVHYICAILTDTTKQTIMRKYLAIISVSLLCMFSCRGQKVASADAPEQVANEVFTFEDSCQHLVVKLSLELPMGSDEASKLMRDSLIADFMANCRQPGYDQENEFAVKPYSGNLSDPQAIVNYFGKADYDYLLAQAMSDYNERVKYADEDPELSVAERERIKNDVPRWTFEMSLKKETDNPRFDVYLSQSYVYYGGAHGGVTGSGALTFDKATGKKISRFIKEDSTSALQPLLSQGPLRYFHAADYEVSDSNLNNCLSIPDGIIPQPTDNPCPNAAGDSLLFTYRQYEIAPYAAGMPNFSIPVKDLMPYLTPEGKALLTK